MAQAEACAISFGVRRLDLQRSNRKRIENDCGDFHGRRKRQGNKSPEVTFMKPRISLLLILAVAVAASLILTGCSTVGSAIDGTGRALSKAGRSVKNI